MKQKELISALIELRKSIDNERMGKGFVSSIYLESVSDKINALGINIEENGIEYENFYEENGIQFCSCCNQRVSKIKKHIDKTMISGLIKAFDYVMFTNSQTFMIKDIPLNRVEYGVLNHLVRFGLLYKSEGMKRGEYGVPRKTVSLFMRGQWRVAKYFIQDPTKRDDQREMSEERILISDIPSVDKLREEFGDSLVSYEWNEGFE